MANNLKGASVARPKNHKIGRPSKLTKQLQTEICKRIAEGQSLRHICEDARMPALNNVRIALLKRPDFRVQYALARDEQADYYADRLVEIAENVPANKDQIERAKLLSDNIKWVASKLKPKKYGDKLDLTSGGERLEQPIYGGRSVSNNKSEPIEGEVVKPKRLPSPTPTPQQGS